MMEISIFNAVDICQIVYLTELHHFLIFFCPFSNHCRISAAEEFVSMEFFLIFYASYDRTIPH